MDSYRKLNLNSSFGVQKIHDKYHGNCIVKLYSKASGLCATWTSWHIKQDLQLTLQPISWGTTQLVSFYEYGALVLKCECSGPVLMHGILHITTLEKNRICLYFEIFYNSVAWICYHIIIYEDITCGKVLFLPLVLEFHHHCHCRS
jgi:hypothetical protein